MTMPPRIGEPSNAQSLRIPRNPAIRIRQAVRDNNVPLLQRLSRKMDLRNTDKNRLTSLSWAAADGSLEVFEWLLLDYGHDDQELSRDNDNNTLLHLLASIPSPQPSSLPHSTLFPARHSARSVTEQSRVGLQMTHVYHSLFPFLLDWSNSSGKTALHIAAQSGNTPFISALCEYGADADLTDLQGNSPLHYAAAWGHLDVARVLLDRGALWAVRNFEGFTPGDYAFSEEVRRNLVKIWEGVKEERKSTREMAGSISNTVRNARPPDMDGQARFGAERVQRGMTALPGFSRNPSDEGSFYAHRALHEQRSGSYFDGRREAEQTRWRSGSASTTGSAMQAVRDNSNRSHGNDEYIRQYSFEPNLSQRGQDDTRDINTALPPRQTSLPLDGSPNPSSGYNTPRYDPPPELERAGANVHYPSRLSTRSPHRANTGIASAATATPPMSRQGSDERGLAQPLAPIPTQMPNLPHISITRQVSGAVTSSPTAFGNPPALHHQQPETVHQDTTVAGGRRPNPHRSPSLPTAPRFPPGNTPAMPTAAGPPINLPTLGVPVGVVDGGDRSGDEGGWGPQSLRRSSSARIAGDWGGIGQAH